MAARQVDVQQVAAVGLGAGCGGLIVALTALAPVAAIAVTRAALTGLAAFGRGVARNLIAGQIQIRQQFLRCRVSKTGFGRAGVGCRAGLALTSLATRAAFTAAVAVAGGAFARVRIRCGGLGRLGGVQTGVVGLRGAGLCIAARAVALAVLTRWAAFVAACFAIARLALGVALTTAAASIAAAFATGAVTWAVAFTLALAAAFTTATASVTPGLAGAGFCGGLARCSPASLP